MGSGNSGGGYDWNSSAEVQSSLPSHQRQKTPNKKINVVPTKEEKEDNLAESAGPIAQSWNRFREILHNIESEELEERHALLHQEDQLMHEELARRGKA